MRKLPILDNPRYLWLIAALAGVLNVLPSLLVYPAGDLLHSYALIQCYGEQIWQGHFYPRWCMGANAGYGSPVPIFYFPLPYYISTLLYPLRYFGMEITGVYMAALWLAHSVTFFNVTLWLKHITTPLRAMFCAFVFLWMSYRMEVAAFRSSYAELWAIAFMPLLFLQVRKLVVENERSWHKLALIIAICMLCHAPATLIGLMGAGIYSLQKIKALPTLFFATAIAFAATLFHWQAATWFKPMLSTEVGGVEFWKTSWINNFVDQVHPPDLFLNFVLMGMSGGFILLFLAFIGYKRALIVDEAVRKEAIFWGATIIFGVIMMFSVSSPLWMLIELVSKVKTPWRMAALPMFGLVYFLALYSRYYWPVFNYRKCSAALVAAFFIISGNQQVQTVENQDLLLREIVVYTQQIFGFFNTRWTEGKYTTINPELFYDHYVFDRPKGKAFFITGDGEITLKSWGYDGLAFHIKNTQPGVVRIEHLYNPIWHAQFNGKPVELTPETGDLGRMLVSLPPNSEGDLIVTLNATAALPPAYQWVRIVSGMSFLAIVLGFYLARPRKVI